ncbi:hypothetical protein QBC38DRAFT_476990 [Podospora fimiseda]|uniref:Uncharacterized protein n=1 Tax=Podospora fimiseda TaxID=252190 RepID=A0AAN7BQN5_9PEZI|nr:hypothetical protein QBC38DRAFT_476990 [Podospora fimiseda]
MSAQSPSSSVPSQPPKAAAYSSAGAKRNPITRSLSEFAVADTPGESYAEDLPSGDYLTARRTANDQSSSSMPQSQERGVHGGVPTDQRESRETHYAAEGQHTYEAEEVDAEGEKMAPSTEGEVAAAVRHDRHHRRGSSGSPHGRVRGEISLDKEEGDLERKKAQQEVMRGQVMEARERGDDVDGRREHEKQDVMGEGRREHINLV